MSNNELGCSVRSPILAVALFSVILQVAAIPVLIIANKQR